MRRRPLPSLARAPVILAGAGVVQAGARGAERGGILDATPTEGVPGPDNVRV